MVSVTNKNLISITILIICKDAGFVNSYILEIYTVMSCYYLWLVKCRVLSVGKKLKTVCRHPAVMASADGDPSGTVPYCGHSRTPKAAR